MNQNLKRYSAYVVAQNLLFWTPVFFLVFSTYLSLQEVLYLEGFYYLCVVLAEIPSGYASDRWGRKPVLVLSALSGVIAYGLFGWATHWFEFGLAQFFLALSIAFNSGSDTSFHFDTLEAAGRRDEFGEREGYVIGLSLIAVALAGLLGGAMASVHLQSVYFASCGAALVALVLALSLREPEHQHHAKPPLEQLQAVKHQLAVDSVLRWYAAAVVIMVVLNHVPYEFYQPYLQRSLPELRDDLTLILGVHTTLALLGAAFVSRHSHRIAAALGPPRAVLLGQLLMVVLVAVMASAFTLLGALLLLGRSVPRGLVAAPLNVAIATRVDESLRATFLSVLSLLGRLSYGGLLLLTGVVVQDASDVGLAITTALLVCSSLVLVLWLTRPRAA